MSNSLKYKIINDVETTYVEESKIKQVRLDKFTICPDEKLGTGAFSSVYLCKDKDNNKAAVKVLSKHTKKSENIIKVAKAQVKIIRKLKHPNIVGLYGSYESENNYYILFQYCQGKNLRQILNQNKKVQLANAHAIINGLISALCYLHERKVMHRDIKPDNIKYFQGKPTLLDFGFACQLHNGAKTMLTESVGTPSYMSPQMLRNRPYNFKSDIWSFGVVIYEIIYGKLPWYGRSEAQLFSNIMKHPLVFPSHPVIKPELKGLIQGCLQKKFNQRIGMEGLQQFYKLKTQKIIQNSSKQQNCNLFCWFN